MVQPVSPTESNFDTTVLRSESVVGFTQAATVRSMAALVSVSAPAVMSSLVASKIMPPQILPRLVRCGPVASSGSSVPVLPTGEESGVVAPLH